MMRFPLFFFFYFFQPARFVNFDPGPGPGPEIQGVGDKNKPIYQSKQRKINTVRSTLMIAIRPLNQGKKARAPGFNEPGPFIKIPGRA